MRLEALQTFDQSDVWTKDKKTKTKKRVLYCDDKKIKKEKKKE